MQNKLSLVFSSILFLISTSLSQASLANTAGAQKIMTLKDHPFYSFNYIGSEKKILHFKEANSDFVMLTSTLYSCPIQDYLQILCFSDSDEGPVLNIFNDDFSDKRVVEQIKLNCKYKDGSFYLFPDTPAEININKRDVISCELEGQRGIIELQKYDKKEWWHWYK